MRYPDGTAHLYWLGGDVRRKGERRQPGYSESLGPDGYWLSGADAAEYLYDLAGGLSGIQDVATGTELGTVATDAAGRVTFLEYQGRTRTMTWDVAGRLRDVTVPGGVSGSTTVTYAYDVQGRRVGSESGTARARWVWGASELLEERRPATSGSGPAQVYERVGALAVAAGGQRILHDALGSTVGRWDGTEATLHRYDAWGGYVAGASGAGSPSTAPGQGDPSIGYTGHQWDGTASLVYAKARWYAPELGSFLSRDPVLGVPGNPVTWNAFLYANGNPLKYVDPTGAAGMARDDWYHTGIPAGALEEVQRDTAMQRAAVVASVREDIAGLQQWANAGITEAVGRQLDQCNEWLPSAYCTMQSTVSASALQIGAGAVFGIADSPAYALETADRAYAEGRVLPVEDFRESWNLASGLISEGWSEGNSDKVWLGVAAYAGMGGGALLAVTPLRGVGSKALGGVRAGAKRAVNATVSGGRNLGARLAPRLNPRNYVLENRLGGVGGGVGVRYTGPRGGAGGGNAAARRAYLNQKFGRSGNLDADINVRGLDEAIRTNAFRAADYARLDQVAGRIGSGPQRFGTRAHLYFERFNNRLANRMAGTVRLSTEQFRNPLGRIVPRRVPRVQRSIGADLVVEPWAGGPVRNVYDLKTFSAMPRPISVTRQNQFLFRFGVRAEEIYVPQ